MQKNFDYEFIYINTVLENNMWKCSICLLVFVTLRFFVSHVYVQHAQSQGLQINCPVPGCAQSYTKYNSLYRHIHRAHSSSLDVTCISETPDNMEERDVTNQPRSSQNEFDNQSPCIVTADHLTDTEPEHTCTCPTQEIMSEDELYSHEEDSNNDPTLYSESAYREAIQRLVVTYTMNLKEIYRTRETTTQFIAEQTDLIVQQHLHFVQQKLLHTLRLRHGMTEEGQNIIKEIFNTTDLPFDGLTTSYGRNRYIRNTFNIVEPEIVHVGFEHILKRRHGQEILEVMNASFSYIPMIESIQQFLQNDDIANLVFGRPNFAPNGLLNDFVDGSVFQTHPLLLGNNEALHLSIYFDDLEICNPLGKNAGIHKIGVFYYSILNLPISYRSRLPAIRVLAIIKRKTMSKFGINNVLRRINKDLELLAEGVNMSIKGENKIIKGAAIAFVGDTLASHEFCGFKIGVGFAFQKCRECECTNTDMQTKFHERFFQQRNLDRYDEQCRELAIATTKGLFRRLSMAYGINSRSCCRDWPYFNLLEMTPEDIMHVVFEGVALYEVKATLKVLVAEDFFSLSQLNNLISSFPYGYKDRECQPSCIPDNVFNSDDTSLRQSASSMIVFLKLLPLMLIEKLNCDRENEYVTFLSQFCEIVKLLMASVISVETVAMLKIMIESHLKKFKDLFSEKTIIPKQHYLVHLLNAIIRYGPLTQVWSMRYEGKHQFIKQRMSGNPNFKNVVKSLSERCVMYEASLNIGEQHSLFSNDLILGKFKAVVNNECKNKIAAFFGTNVDGIKSIYAVNWIIYNGQKFVKNRCEIAFGENNSLPEFGTLTDIWVTIENNTQHIYFVLEMFETIEYREDIQGFKIRKPDMAQGFELIRIQNIFLHVPLHAYFAHDNFFICPPFDMMDLIRLKQERM